ncbi:MAG: 23S rRNA (cytosine(1962)-C(5))-methyltransferase RlmI [Hydrogenophilales bacterium CG_4_9_14_3_um_filter_59_35]|nr:MAG: 23S rRNA (cytosine(1962)-C(5))-methyltransferase RlmI [Hydrogenophilales bacterium CG18_big_fil_WC_8_21_14_2_50_58_12]PIY01097.1 MAG: 23S rRNA (cytosine(1962)-C(5))-methyltransferase RlmI [Hydrogenophilales bacterium CG_4_10_14_3_um_filter_58_23]PJB04991.1 MAG: 23S rRNA (cytosine(1962)-C(5))-methyltransferase RlmI [Hydrogenophilales bacterium CG_4_9_14_3_um_filter_59_35]
MNSLILNPGREKSLQHRHPWIFTGAVDRIKGEPQSGETVAVRDTHGAFLALAAYSPKSQILGRVWTYRENETVDEVFLRARLARAIGLRQELAKTTDGMRLVHGESDGLPGLVVDRYADTLVMQVLSAGMERWRGALADLLVELTGCANLYERSDAEVRDLEGLSARAGILRGVLPAPLVIREQGLKFYVDVEKGQKTGFYLDQRDNRRRVGELANDKDVLNCFCYSGGFSLSALQGGARSVLSVDSSAEALALARENVTLNNLAADRAEWLEADVFKSLRLMRDQGKSFDLIVLDPPKFAPTAHHAANAARAYKDINLWALKLLRPGGLLATFSCSGGVTADLFQKILAGAALDANVTAQIVGRFAADADHPAVLNFPEGEYLKGLLLRRVE